MGELKMTVKFGTLFLNKHIHIPKTPMGEADMRQEAMKVFLERNADNDPAKKAQYGKIKPDASTLIVISEGEKEKILSWAQTNVTAAGVQYAVEINGAILTPRMSGEFGSLFSEMDADYCNNGNLRFTAQADGANFEINHLVSVDNLGVLQSVKISKGGMSFTV
jgi:hypothetical protein